MESVSSKIRLYHGTDYIGMRDILIDGVIDARNGKQTGETKNMNWFFTENRNNYSRGFMFSIELTQEQFCRYEMRFMTERAVANDTPINIDEVDFRIEEAFGHSFNDLFNIWNYFKQKNNSLDEQELIYEYINKLSQFTTSIESECINVNDYVMEQVLKQIVGENKLREYGFLDESTLYEIDAEDLNLASFKIKNELHPKFWIDNKLNSKVRLKLLDIADDFYDTLSIGWIKPIDIVLTGSIANYNWSKYSDIDVHVLIDYKDVYDKREFVEDYFKAKKDLWSEEHPNLKIYGFPVELYVEDINSESVSSGVYSLNRNEWIVEPGDLQNAKMNETYVKSTAAKIMTTIDDFSEKIKNEKNIVKVEKYQEQLKNLFKKIKKIRREGLKNGEMGSGNIIFKILRRAEYLDKLWDLINTSYDKINSIQENRNRIQESDNHDFFVYYRGSSKKEENNYKDTFHAWLTPDINYAMEYTNNRQPIIYEYVLDGSKLEMMTEYDMESIFDEEIDYLDGLTDEQILVATEEGYNCYDFSTHSAEILYLFSKLPIVSVRRLEANEIKELLQEKKENCEKNNKTFVITETQSKTLREAFYRNSMTNKNVWFDGKPNKRAEFGGKWIKVEPLNNWICIGTAETSYAKYYILVDPTAPHNMESFENFKEKYVSANEYEDGSDGFNYIFNKIYNAPVEIYDEFKGTYYDVLFNGINDNYRNRKKEQYMSKCFIVGDDVIAHHDSNIKITDGVIKVMPTKNHYSKSTDWGSYFWLGVHSGGDQSNGGKYTYYCKIPLSEIYFTDSTKLSNNEKHNKENILKEYPYVAGDWTKGNTVACQSNKPTPIWCIRVLENGEINWYDKNWNIIQEPNILKEKGL